MRNDPKNLSNAEAKAAYREQGGSRKDPDSRPVDGDINDLMRIVNMDPNRVYCVANPNDEMTGLYWMQRQGWEVELSRADGPRIDGVPVANDGSAVTAFGGQILMSRTREAHEAYCRRRDGVADMRSKAIGQPGGVDGVRTMAHMPLATNRTTEEFERG